MRIIRILLAEIKYVLYVRSHYAWLWIGKLVISQIHMKFSNR